MRLALLTQTGDSGGIPLTELGQYGAAGVILSIFLWFGYRVYSAEKKRADENAAKLEALQNKVADVYVPSMEKWGQALTETQALLREIREDRAPARRRS